MASNNGTSFLALNMTFINYSFSWRKFSLKSMKLSVSTLKSCQGMGTLLRTLLEVSWLTLTYARKFIRTGLTSSSASYLSSPRTVWVGIFASQSLEYVLSCAMEIWSSFHLTRLATSTCLLLVNAHQWYFILIERVRNGRIIEMAGTIVSSWTRLTMEEWYCNQSSSWVTISIIQRP